MLIYLGILAHNNKSENEIRIGKLELVIKSKFLHVKQKIVLI